MKHIYLLSLETFETFTKNRLVQLEQKVSFSTALVPARAEPSLNLRFNLQMSLHVAHLLSFNPLNAQLNPIRHLLALVAARHFVHVSRIRVNTNVICFRDVTSSHAQSEH